MATTGAHPKVQQKERTAGQASHTRPHLNKPPQLAPPKQPDPLVLRPRETLEEYIAAGPSSTPRARRANRPSQARNNRNRNLVNLSPSNYSTVAPAGVVLHDANSTGEPKEDSPDPPSPNDPQLRGDETEEELTRQKSRSPAKGKGNRDATDGPQARMRQEESRGQPSLDAGISESLERAARGVAKKAGDDGVTKSGGGDDGAGEKVGSNKCDANVEEAAGPDERGSLAGVENQDNPGAGLQDEESTDVTGGEAGGSTSADEGEQECVAGLARSLSELDHFGESEDDERRKK